MSRNDPDRFLNLLHEFKSEIEERWSEYFEYQALRIADDGSAEDIYDLVGAAYGLSLIVEPDLAKFNSIDKLFHWRLNDLCGPQEFASAQRSELLHAIRETQDRTRSETNARALSVFDRFQRKRIEHQGSAAIYLAAGEGHSTVVILNALGHGLSYWRRLLDRLLPRHRILIPDTSLTAASAAGPSGITAQVENLELILRHEKIASAHLLGWCTGPKVAVAFYRRCPSLVSSLILLNSSFTGSERRGELDTMYEQQLEHLCRALLEQPEMASVVRKAFLANTGEPDANQLSRMNAKELAVAVLSRSNADLKQHILDPFRSDAATIEYAQQVMDFLAYDAVADAREVLAPVLLVGAEYDSVAAPATTDFMARQFPNAQAINIRGATHYCLYDRPGFIADLIEEFLANSEIARDVVLPQALQFSPRQETLWI